ncbi:MAG: cyclic nucleotide-binding domain-containing protein [Gemmatimonadota bacterium]
MSEPRPHRTLRLVWEVLVASTAALLAITLPIRLLSGGDRGLPPIAEVFVTVVFGVDFVLRVRARRSSGAPTGPAWATVDALAALPLAPLLHRPEAGLLRLVKLLRAFPLFGGIGHRLRANPALLRLGGFVLILLVLAHWLACAWMALGGRGPGGLARASYLEALYWTVTTLTTVGYGDVTPATAPQRLYAMSVMLLGVGVYGFVIGNVATLLTRVDMARAQYVATLDRLSGFLRYRRVPLHVQRHIFDYYRYLWEHRMGYDEASLLEDLPPTLRQELSLVLKGDLIEKLSFLEGASKELILDLCMRLRPLVFTPGDTIVRAGEEGRDIYFISGGAVEVLAPDGTRVGTLTDGDFFGELALLRSQPRTATVRALGYCDLYALDRDAFLRTLERYPDFAERIEEIARSRPHLEG